MNLLCRTTPRNNCPDSPLAGVLSCMYIPNFTFHKKILKNKNESSLLHANAYDKSKTPLYITVIQVGFTDCTTQSKATFTVVKTYKNNLHSAVLPNVEKKKED